MWTIIFIIALILIIAALAAFLYLIVAEASPIVERPLRDEQEIKFFSAFSNTYFEARRKFREAAKAAGAKLSTHLVCMDPSTGLELTIDIAVLNAPPQNNNNNNNIRTDTIVHLSGCHGVEGFTGSAIQIRALENMAKDTSKSASSSYDPTRPTIIFVHAVNPFGMANYRRFNENNVDLNRNCLATEKEWNAVRSREPNQFGYERFRHLFNPPALPRFVDKLFIWGKIAFNVLVHGFSSLKRTFVTGQYHHPQGLYYGGQRLEKSWCIIRDALSPYIAPQKSKTGGAGVGGVSPSRRLIVIDVHSGLGPSGVDSIMIDTRRDYLNAMDVFPSGCIIDEPDTASSDAATSGYDDAVGATDLEALCCGLTSSSCAASPATVKHDPTIAEDYQKRPKLFDFYLCLTQEFGTVPAVLVARGVMFENAAYQLSPFSPSHRMGQNMSRAGFYVESYSWKESVLRRGLERLDQAVDYFRKNQ